jgi:hypothetical protein
VGEGARRNEVLRQHHEAKVLARSDVPDGIGLSIQVRVVLDGAYLPAQQIFAEAVQTYATKLADESSYQEATSRAAGARTAEITESTVLRAREALDKLSVSKRPTSALEPLLDCRYSRAPQV